MEKALAIVFILIGILIGMLIGGWTGAIFLGGLSLLLILFLVTVDAAIVRVPEWKVVPIFNREMQRFERFLPPGRHMIKPFVEYAGEMITLGSTTTTGTCEDALTLGGIPISIDWSVRFTMDPLSLESPALRSKMARALPKSATKIVTNHANNLLRHIISKHTIDYFIERVPQEELETKLKDAVQKRVAALSITVAQVMILNIRMPQHVLAALETAQEQLIASEAGARALRCLHEAIDDFDSEDIDHLERLERLKLIGTEGGSMAYLMSSWIEENARQMNRDKLRPVPRDRDAPRNR